MELKQGGRNGRGWADKGRAGIWGSFLVHLGFLTLILGMAVGHQLGFKGFYMSPAGSTYALTDIETQQGTVSTDLSVHIYAAEEKFDAAGHRDNWYTDIGVSRDGVELKRALISVNHPLTVEGISFYQASFAPGVSLVADIKGEQTLLGLQPQARNYFHAPGTSLYLICDQIGLRDGKTIISYQVLDEENPTSVQTGELVQGERKQIQDGYELTLLGPANFTGLQIKKDPGVPLVWLGCLLIMLGLVLSFYFKPARLWFAWREDGSVAKPVLALTTAAGAEAARELLERLVQMLEANSGPHQERGEYTHELE